jgi:NAD(P)-dependent dehydrogenase (short-subunit alcohol dehydrogenase family)
MSKIVFITGGSSGIGKATAIYLSKKGYIVYGTGRKVINGSVSDGFTSVQMDITNSDSLQSAIQFVLAKEHRIDVLINNAGLGMAGALEDCTKEEIQNIFNTNVVGTLEVSKALLPQMRLQKDGLIINVSSIMGRLSLPFRGIYSASKFALEAISETLSMEVRQFGIKVVCLEPGDFNTEINTNRVVAQKSRNSIYSEKFNPIYKQITEEVGRSADPIVVAKVIEKIILSSNPKLRYKAATWFQGFAVFLHNFLPPRIFEKLVMNKYRL